MFSHLPVEGHLGCFLFQAITSNVSVNIRVQVWFEHMSSFLWDKCLVLKLLGCMEVVYLVFKELAKLISGVGVPLHIPSKDV